MWTAETRDRRLYFLERGQVAIKLSKESGSEVIIRLINVGELFGELCFCSLRNQPRLDCAQTTIDSTIVEFAFDDFMVYLQENIEALKSFTFTFCERLADAERRIEILSYRGAEARLGHLLLQMAATSGMKSSKRSGGMRLTVGHDELARMAAMTRPHVTVTMGKLRNRGLVHYDRGSQLTVNVIRLTKYLTPQTTRTGK